MVLTGVVVDYGLGCIIKNLFSFFLFTQKVVAYTASRSFKPQRCKIHNNFRMQFCRRDAEQRAGERSLLAAFSTLCQKTSDSIQELCSLRKSGFQ